MERSPQGNATRVGHRSSSAEIGFSTAAITVILGLTNASRNSFASGAEEKGLSLEEWEQVKVGILTNCFFMVAMKDEQIRNDLGMDIYEELNA